MATPDKQPTTPGLGADTHHAVGASMGLDGDTEALARYYAGWAADYDTDLGEEDYGLPRSMALVVARVCERRPDLRPPQPTVLDAGCGTGRVGVALAAAGYTTIDGIDLSPEMVARAKATGVYRTLEAGLDLTRAPPDRWRRSADIVTVGGVFTIGHLPPTALHQVAELVAPGGLLVTSVRPGYYDTTDYGAVSEAFGASDRAGLLFEIERLPYTADSHGRYFAYRITG